MRLAITVVSIFILATNVFAYTPPKGIPDPGWGIDTTTPTTDGSGNNTWCPQWPTTQNSESHGDTNDCYYIDNTSVSCNDSNAGGYGTPNAPRCTLPTGRFNAGTFVDIHGGTEATPYEDRAYSNVTIYGTGTSERPIVFTGKNQIAKPVFSWGHIFLVGNEHDASYVIIENMHFHSIGTKYAYGIAVRAEAGHTNQWISIRNNEGHGSEAANEDTLLSVGEDAPSTGNTLGRDEYIIVYNNKYYEIGPWNIAGNEAGQKDTSGVALAANIYNVWILENEIYKVQSGSVGSCHEAYDHTEGVDDFTCDNVFIGRNNFSHHRESLIDIKSIKNVVISENYLHDCPSALDIGYDTGAAVTVHYGGSSPGPINSWIMFNRIHNVDQGISSSHDASKGNPAFTYKVYAIGNVITGVTCTKLDSCDNGSWSYGGAITFHGGNENYIIDNSIYGYDKGIQAGGGANQANYIIGNIISNRTSSAYGKDIDIDSADGTVDIDHTLLYKGDRDNIIMKLGAATYTSLSAYKSAYETQCLHNCAEADPIFVSSSNLRLTTSSTNAIGNGTEHAVYDAFATEHPTWGSIHYDNPYTGVVLGTAKSRPVDTWDIGAYEYNPATVRPVMSISTGAGVSIGSGATMTLY